MKRAAVLLIGIAIAVVLGAVYLWGPSSVPQGQEPLVVLSHSNFSEFQNAFDADADVPRLLLLLSPT